MSAQVIKLYKTNELEARCSFCGKSKTEAKSMVSGVKPGSHICDVCIAIAKARIVEAGA